MTEKADELRAWFDLIIDLKSKGFTPQQVKAYLFDPATGRANSRLKENSLAENQTEKFPWNF